METERLCLRRFVPGDFGDLLEYLSDEEVVRYEPYRAMNPEEVRENLNWRIGAEEMIAVCLKDTGKLIGNVYLEKQDCGNFEIGYVFNRAYWGSGYAKEACLAVMDQTFSSGAHRISAMCDPKNPASWHLLESLGFRREAHLLQNVYFWKDEQGNPIWKDTYIYALLASAWSQR